MGRKHVFRGLDRKARFGNFLATETYASGVCSAGGGGGQCLLFRDFFPVSVSLRGFEPDRREALPVPSGRFLIARGLASSGITRMG